MAQAHILGFPRIGAQRELKFSIEAIWRGEQTDLDACEAGIALRRRNAALQQEAGLDWLTAGDFAFYDHMLNQTVLLGATPKRFGFDPKHLTLAQYFELARGNAAQPAMEMTKWFDTNYHYLVPELDSSTRFDGGVDWYFDQIAEAQTHSRSTKPVLIGPVTYLWLAKSSEANFDRLTLLPQLLERYQCILQRLAAMGIEWVQMDEPALCVDLDGPWLEACRQAYASLAQHDIKLLLATYFGSTAPIATLVARLPVHGFHIDLVRAPEQLAIWLDLLPATAVLSAGIVDGRNVWRADLRRLHDILEPVHALLGDRLWIAPSCSLLHVPVSLESETRIDPEIRQWLAFATEKLFEVRTLARALNQGEQAVVTEFSASDAAHAARRTSSRVHDPLVRERLASITPVFAQRKSTFSRRIAAQHDALQLPLLPTTTIGSFPQTTLIRQARAAFRRGELPEEQYHEQMRAEIKFAVAEQESLGLDVLVHGEAERNDMVEYFGEQLTGYVFTQNGWVQSYGSRCVKPPIIYGDVSRPRSMTVETTRYAQSLTRKWMKGMLTGPVTMLQWSFVRDDQAKSETAFQLALAIRDEVADLEQAGIRIIQIDEPAFREGLPLRKKDWNAYLDWAAAAFRVSASVVRDETQIHTHMCYAEFNDILPSIAAMDADVITIETSRSNMELLDGFGAYRYPNEIGPGVYDIHSPRVPTVEEMTRLLERAMEVIPVEQLWVNPDCGLKTRGWTETRAALANMVKATNNLRHHAQL